MIVLSGLTKTYGGQPILRGVTVEARAGEVVALVGPNGAGKSTTLRIAAGIVRADAGSATINGLDVRLPDARRFLGYLPQKGGVPASTSLLALARLVVDLRGLPAGAARQALATAGLDHRRHAGLGELSGGQRQRVMLALATLGPVTALLLDEPGISLDVDGAEEVHGLIQDARSKGCAVLFASHHLADVAALADRVAILVDGVVVEQGTLPHLARRAGISWTEATEPPIETIYRTLVTRSRGTVPSPLSLLRPRTRGAA